MELVKILKTCNAIFILASMFTLQACIQDDLSECGIGVHFRYVKNVDRIDKFASSIDKITLFVFDEGERFIGSYSEEGEALKSDYVMYVPLKHGKYKLVAWGNLCDDYDYTQCVQGQTTMQDFLLSLKCEQDTSWQHPTHLFYGGIEAVELDKPYTGRKHVTMDMMKNTNTIHVVNRGLPITKSTAAYEGFECVISSTNESHRIDNSLTGNRITYMSQYTSEEGVLQSDFVTMRELNDGSTQSNIRVTYHPDNGTPSKDIFNYNLTELLVPLSITGDLDIDDEFTIDLLHDYTHGTVTITIKDWVIVVNGDGDVIG